MMTFRKYLIAVLIFLFFSVFLFRSISAQDFLKMNDQQWIELAIDMIRKGVQQQDTSKIAMASAPCPFQIKISSDKGEYLLREPILISYEIRNMVDSIICLTFDQVDESFNIKDQLGRGYSNMVTSSYMACPDTLKPNETFKRNVGVDSRYRIYQAGEYTCYVDFCGIKSNVLKITVKNPSGEEKKALDIFLEAEGLKWARDNEGKKDLKKMELGFLKYQELVDKYPNSIYAALALNRAIGTYKFSPDFDQMQKIIPPCKRLIENYSNSIYFTSVFMSLVDVYEILKDKAGAVATMNELIEKHPNTKISEEAKKRLEQIEKWKF